MVRRTPPGRNRCRFSAPYYFLQCNKLETVWSYRQVAPNPFRFVLGTGHIPSDNPARRYVFHEKQAPIKFRNFHVFGEKPETAVATLGNIAELERLVELSHCWQNDEHLMAQPGISRGSAV